MEVSVAETGIKPDLNPTTLELTELIGSQGWAKSDCVTVWFYCPCQHPCLWLSLAVDRHVPLDGTGTAPTTRAAH